MGELHVGFMREDVCREVYMWNALAGFLKDICWGKALLWENYMWGSCGRISGGESICGMHLQAF